MNECPACSGRGRLAAMTTFRRVFLGTAILFASNALAADLRLSDDEPLRLPAAGSCQLRIITPTLLELIYVTAVKQGAERPAEWDFINSQGQGQLPSPDQVTVTASDRGIAVKTAGFKRRVLYAPF